MLQHTKFHKNAQCLNKNGETAAIVFKWNLLHMIHMKCHI